MILVADSGATKTDWCLLSENGKKSFFQTQGLNPSYVSDFQVFYNEFTKLQSWVGRFDDVEKIYFYGAGCSTIEACQKIQTLGNKYFTKAETLVFTDMFGACRAVCGNKDGIVGILGTGSNSCVYKDSKITENIPSVGYMLGDEGSGTYIGKNLLKKYLTGFMPEELANAFAKKLPWSRAEFLDRIYHQAAPNQLFKSITPFAVEHKDHPFIKNLVKDCFCDFFENQIVKYKNYNTYNLYFVGSVAFLFANELAECATKHNLQITDIQRSPIEGLSEFHLKNEKR